MGVLILGQQEQARIAEIVAHATAHPHVPGVTPVPGDDPRHIFRIGRYRCVFSHTIIEQRTYRYFSISSIPRGLAPNIAIAAVLATRFGFVGECTTWLRDYDYDEHIGFFVQEIQP